MINLKKILVPTDFSSGSKVAYEYAREMAERFNAQIDFIHVVPSMKYLTESISNLGLPFDMDRDIYPHLVEKAKQMTEEDIKQYIPNPYRGKSIVVIDRKPSEDIITMANNDGYDMIVMGARGAHDDGVLKWGTITEKVIRHSNIPVLSVPGKMPEHGIKKILLPTDLSETSFEGLPLAVTIAGIFESELTLFHVLELYGTASENTPRDPSKSELEDIDQKLYKSMSDALEQQTKIKAYVERVPYQLYDNIVIEMNGDEATIRFYTKVVKGISAHYEIVDFATDNMDMIVMGTHGRSGLKHLFLGSNTEKVAQHSKVPVITFRSHKVIAKETEKQ
jgi:nucleotide-binding universal stress UspA family protein